MEPGDEGDCDEESDVPLMDAMGGGVRAVTNALIVMILGGMRATTFPAGLAVEPFDPGLIFAVGCGAAGIGGRSGSLLDPEDTVLGRRTNPLFCLEESSVLGDEFGRDNVQLGEWIHSRVV